MTHTPATGPKHVKNLTGFYFMFNMPYFFKNPIDGQFEHFALRPR